MPNALLCCGGLRTDFIITLESEARLMEMGGNAIYAAAGARLWRDDVAIIGRVGDNFPQTWLAELRARGFDTRGIISIGGTQDHRTFYAYIDADTRTDTNPAAHFARIGVPLPDALRDYVHSTPGQDNPNSYEPLAVTPEDLLPALRGRAEVTQRAAHRTDQHPHPTAAAGRGAPARHRNRQHRPRRTLHATAFDAAHRSDAGQLRRVFAQRSGSSQPAR